MHHQQKVCGLSTAKESRAIPGDAHVRDLFLLGSCKISNALTESDSYRFVTQAEVNGHQKSAETLRPRRLVRTAFMRINR